jgi:outer membrane protein OmpA-like peptidoglycan-associated protein
MTHTNLFTATLACLYLIGCSTTPPPADLVEARHAYRDAEVDGRRAAPKDLNQARIALAQAEAAYKDGPTRPEVRDRAYIAQRRAQIASMSAATIVAHETRDASYQKLRVLGVDTAKDLKDARRSLDAAEQQSLSSKLEADVLKKSLDQSETESAVVKARADSEREAGLEADRKIMSALQAMSAAQSVREEPRGLVITLSGAVLFETGQSTLRGPARQALDGVAEALIAVPDRSITVEGHTDSRGGERMNQTLSEARSEAVRQYLVTRGVDASRVAAVGRGASQPSASNDSVEGRSTNRRVEIVLAPATEQR